LFGPGRTAIGRAAFRSTSSLLISKVTMFLGFAHQVADWFKRREAHAATRRGRRRRIQAHLYGAIPSQLEILESRQLLTSVIGVHVSGNSIRLTELRGPTPATGNNFSITYNSSQVVLTGTNGTEFRVSGQTQATDTINITGPASITMLLNRQANVVSITGDGTDSLSKLNLHLGSGKESNSVTLSQVIADSVNIRGRRSNDSVTLNQSTVNGNLTAILGSSSGDVLDLESTTIDGNLHDRVGQLTMNQSTVKGKLHDVEPGKNSTLDSTDSTYTGNAAIQMGPSGTIDLLASGDGFNHFESSVSIVGARHQGTTVNQDPESVLFDVTPKSRNATFTTTSASPPTLGAPTVNSQTITTNVAPVITGTFDSANTSVLSVTANSQTFTLGTNSQLTSPTAGQWSLNLGSAALAAPVTTVTVTTTDKNGNQTSGTGTITDGAGIIANYLTANQLTATTTADGLAIVTKTQGTGALPTAGQTVSVNYSGFLLNSNATLGTEFDSNVDSQFGHVTPFSFVLGAGQVIPGWDEAFKLMPVGTLAELVIPSALAYGAAGNPPSVPPNSILVFNVSVLSAT
jgi:FKBP-type peptidyl-prolyl cis-trans isomerase FkpA